MVGVRRVVRKRLTIPTCLSELSLDHAKRLFPSLTHRASTRVPRETHPGAGAIHLFPQTSKQRIVQQGSDGSAGIAGHAVAFRTADRFETRFHTQPPV